MMSGKSLRPLEGRHYLRPGNGAESPQLSQTGPARAGRYRMTLAWPDREPEGRVRGCLEYCHV